MADNFKSKLNHVKTFIFDIDGVLTDGTIALLPNGDQVRTMNTKDGYPMQLAIKKGYRVCIISGGKGSESSRGRLERLGVTDIFLAIDDKLKVYNEYIKKNNLNPDEVLYMGDDMPDYEILKQCAVPTCPSDAVPEIREICIYISDKSGGKGCVRDVMEQVLKVQGKWDLKTGIASN